MNEDLIQIQQACIEKHLPFATFRLPGQDQSTTYIQTTPGNIHWTSARDLSGETGFILAPFDIRNGHGYLLVRPDRVIRSNRITPEIIREVKALEPRAARVPEDIFPVVTGKETYMSQVEAIKHSISNGAFQKAVLSRIMVVEGEALPKIPRLYQTICRRHPDAFAYLFKSDDQFWMGASPEPLLQRREGSLSTVSLAGTRPFAERHMNINRWTAKEVLEQEYVTRYIHDVLRAFEIRDYRVSSPYVKKAANLLHLQTDFTFGVDRIRDRLWELVDALHPTPAVAGHPKEDAIGFIKKLEPHDRGYYTGFLGPVSRDGELDLFVNLRCMKISPGYLSLYVGGGITLDSDPESEWDETRWKAESLLKILRTHLKNLSPADAPKPAYR